MHPETQNAEIESYDLKIETAQHDAIKNAMGKLIFAPIDFSLPNLRVLDSGTADGHWMRDLLPSLGSTPHLLGADISPSKFPSLGSSPNNIRYMIHSIKDPWPTDLYSTFDFVHQRLVIGACGSFPMPQAIKQLTELVKPGGWIQLIEPEQLIDLKDGPVMAEFMRLIQDVFEGMGGHIRYAGRLGEWLQQAGMVEIQERGVPLFLGAKNDDKLLGQRTAWSSAAGMRPLISYVRGQESYTSLQSAQLETIEVRLREELSERGGYYPLRVVWARKPGGQVP